MPEPHKPSHWDVIGYLSGFGMAMAVALMWIWGRAKSTSALPAFAALFAVSALIGLLWLLFTRFRFSFAQLIAAVGVYGVTLPVLIALEPSGQPVLLTGTNLLIVLVGMLIGARFSSVVPEPDVRLKRWMFAVGLLAPHLMVGGAAAAMFALKSLSDDAPPIVAIIGCGIAAIGSVVILVNAWQTYCPLARAIEQAEERDAGSLGMLRKRKLAGGGAGKSERAKGEAGDGEADVADGVRR